jgi:TPR repeat protein/predicted Zn-dependent protease
MEHSRVVHRCGIAGLVLAIFVLAPSWAAGEEEPNPAHWLAEAEKNLAQARSEIAKRADDPQFWGVLTMMEVMVAHHRATVAAAGDAEKIVPPDNRAISARVLSEWKKLRPQAATPYLVEIQELPPERQEEAVLALLDRFPDDHHLLARTITILSQRHEAARATALVEAALERHPERSELWPLAIRLAESQGLVSRQRELLDGWLDRHPHDANAFRTWMDSWDPGRDPRVAHARVVEFLSSKSVDASRVEICGWLLTLAKGAHREPALRCLADATTAQDAPIRERASALLASTLAGSGDLEGFAQAVAELSPSSRWSAVQTAAQSVPAEDCAARFAILMLVPWQDVPRESGARGWFSSLVGCQRFGSARREFLAAAAQEDGVMEAWFSKVDGRYREDFALAPQLVEVLERRLAAEPEAREVWATLARAYELAGFDERRAAHLTSWLGSKIPWSWPEDFEWLAGFQASQGQFPKAIATLQKVLSQTKSPKIASRLGDLFLMSGQAGQLETFAQQLAADGDPGVAAVAHLLRAHAALASQSADAGERALAQYAAYFATATYPDREVAREYVSIAIGVSGPGVAAEVATTLCAGGLNSGTSLTPAECAASLLVEQGQGEGALAPLEAAVARAPDDLRLLDQLGWAALRVGALDRAEAAFRRIVATDPASANAWRGLGQVVDRRGAVGEIDELLAQAERALGAAPPELTLAVAGTLRKHGEARRAIPLLEKLRSLSPSPSVDIELRLAYAAAASEPTATTVVAKPTASVAQTPSAEHLRALAEIDSVWLGLGGQVDAARAKELIVAAAAKGNPYAAVRLAILHDSGRLGFAQSAKQAAAIATPHLPALRAAAEAGDAAAQYMWGTVLQRGIATGKHLPAAIAWLRKAADRGEAGAQYNLGWAAWAGQGLPQDDQEAVRWFTMAAGAGHASAMTRLANLMLEGSPQVRNAAAGAQWLEKAAERGDPDAVAWWGRRLLLGAEGVAAQPELARPWLEKAAKLDHDWGLYSLAGALLVGNGGPPDEKRAVELFLRVAARGQPAAMFQLLWQQALGRGTARDPQRAEQWIEQAAAHGGDDWSDILGANPRHSAAAQKYFRQGLAQLESLAATGDALAGGILAHLYFSGYGVESDPVRGVAFARRAAAAGSSAAMRVLGRAYRHGQGGVQVDAEQAAAWWGRGAEAGNSFCMMWLSQMLFEGEGVARDPVLALSWLERSGAIGNYWAINNLSHLFTEGRHGIAPDEAKAAIWMRKAAANGVDEAKGWLRAHGLEE